MAEDVRGPRDNNVGESGCSYLTDERAPASSFRADASKFSSWTPLIWKPVLRPSAHTHYRYYRGGYPSASFSRESYPVRRRISNTHLSLKTLTRSDQGNKYWTERVCPRGPQKSAGTVLMRGLQTELEKILTKRECFGLQTRLLSLMLASSTAYVHALEPGH